MASTTQDKLYKTFVAVSGQPDPNLVGTLDSGEEMAASLSDTVKRLGELQAGSAAQAIIGGDASAAPATGGGGTVGRQDSNLDGVLDSGEEVASSLGDAVNRIGELKGNSAARSTSTSSSTADTSGGGITAEAIVSTILESGMGVVPLIVGLLGLFEGGGTPAPPPLVKYAMPDPIYFEGADIGSDAMGADYDQTGMPRAYSAAPNRASAQAGGIAVPGGAASPAAGAPAPQITVNVQAMDSRSFLDHSSEIAQAVRDAMLNLNSINDVVNDL
jgi:hypothetical protein